MHVRAAATMRGKLIFHSMALSLLFAGLGFSASTPEPLDLLHADGNYIRDSAGRVVILRGVTTITLDNDGHPMVMHSSDYEHLRSWGFNVQQIRLEGCKIGLIPPCRTDPAYLDKIASWVDMGAQHGLYSILKATLYDVPGFDWQNISRPATWDGIWHGGPSVENAYVAGWKTVWQRFINNSNVAGYDFLNEPRPGSDESDFTRKSLFPFYRKGAASLQAVDPRKIFFFQPSIRKSGQLEKLGMPNSVFAPHFYVIPKYYTAKQLMEALIHSPAGADVPLLIGEYGDPNVDIGPLRAGTPERDKEDAELFDHHSLGAIRPWYTAHGWWALLQPDGKPNPRITVFSRPYPRRIAGTPDSWQYDLDKHTLNFQYRPDSSIRELTEIYLPQRDYGDGFEVSSSDGLRFASNDHPDGKGKATGALRYDSAGQILTIANPSLSGARTITIQPRSNAHAHRTAGGRVEAPTSRL